MLLFIEEEDFFKVDNYKENEDGSISWFYNELKPDNNVVKHVGVIPMNYIRTVKIHNGFKRVKVGVDIIESIVDGKVIINETDIYGDVPSYDEKFINVWDKLVDLESKNLIIIDRLSEEEKSAIEHDRFVEQFKQSRQEVMDTATVTTSLQNVYDADEISISRMNNAINAASRRNISTIQWSLANTPTGVMSDVPLTDLQEAHELTVENMANVWSINK